MVRRRPVLAVLATGPLLGGCLTVPDGGRPPTEDRTVAVVDRDPPPDVPVLPTVEVAEAEPTEDRPPVLRTTVENVADHPIEVGEERAIVFAYVSSEEESGLTLLPTESDYPAVGPGCWRLAEPIAVAEYYGIVGLAPSERTERHVGVWGSPDGEGCLPAGRFRFSTQYAGARDRGEGPEEQEWRADWGFTLEVR